MSEPGRVAELRSNKQSTLLITTKKASPLFPTISFVFLMCSLSFPLKRLKKVSPSLFSQFAYSETPQCFRTKTDHYTD